MSGSINEQAAPSDTGAAASAVRRGDVAIALKNTVKLGASLLITWTVALAVRFQLPRHLGPETFGQLNFCDAFAGAFFVFIGLGVDTYIQKEIPVRPQHATEFFGGVLLARTLLSIPLLAALAYTLAATGHPSELQAVAIVFGLNHFVYALNNSFSTMLQSSTKVGALALVNVASKLMWGLGLVVAIWLDARLVVLASTFLASELVRTALLLPALRGTIGLKLELHFDTAKRALIASLPFYGTMVAINLGHRLDVSMLEFMASHVEVGWYSAAANFATLAMLLSPLLSWVLMPLLARARHRSLDEFFAILRRALEAILVSAIPITLMMALGADFWVHLAFGGSFAPSAPTLQLMAPMFVATYLAMICSNALILLGRPWLLTIVSVVGLCVGPVWAPRSAWWAPSRSSRAYSSTSSVSEHSTAEASRRFRSRRSCVWRLRFCTWRWRGSGRGVCSSTSWCTRPAHLPRVRWNRARCARWRGCCFNVSPQLPAKKAAFSARKLRP